MEEIQILHLKGMEVMSRKPNLILLCGKSGSGKSYELNLMYNRYYKYLDKINFLTVNTTRPPRLEDIESIDYNFCTKKDFDKEKYLIKKGFSTGEGLHWQYWSYGLPESSIDPDKINIGILDPESILEIKKMDRFNLKVFYISAHPQLRLERSFRKAESTRAYSEICRRFLADEKDFQILDQLDYTIINNSYSEENNHNYYLIYNYIDQLLADKDNMS